MGSDYARRRLDLVAFVFALVTIVLILRLFSLGVVEGAAYESDGARARVANISLLNPRRGCIRDRNGILLAGNTVRYSIEVSPVHIEEEQVDALADELGRVLNQPSAVIAASLESDSGSVVLESNATLEQGQEIESWNMLNVRANPDWSRSYPQGQLMAQVVGFVSRSGDGFYGLEGYYHERLRASHPFYHGEIDVRLVQPIPFDEGVDELPLPGIDLELTLDAAIQALVERELAQALQDYQAERGVVIVMDPRSGAVLAMVGLPTFDPNRYEDFLGQEDLLVSPAVGSRYEPGSIFKIITMAAALDSGTVIPETTYIDLGLIEIGGAPVENSDGLAHGVQDMSGILIHSLNVGSAWLGSQMGEDIFYTYVRAFGFGELTSIEMQGQVAGEFRLPSDVEYHDSDLAANSYGQGIAVTPIQMIAAVAAVANDGLMVSPHLVGRIIEPDGSDFPYQQDPSSQRRVISSQTAQELTEMLVRVVEEGVEEARVPGYRVAGKTGTAEIPFPGGYIPDETIASFVGYGPADDPQVIILVRLDRPQSSQWGSETAAPLFSRLAGQIFPMLGIPPDEGM